MGFLHRLLGLKDSEQPAEKTVLSISVGQVAVHLDALLEGMREACFRDSKNLVEDIVRHKKAAREAVELIRDLEFDEDIKDRTYRPILTSKPVYVKGLLDAFRGIREESPKNYTGLAEFYEGFTKALKAIQSVQFKQGRYVAVAFRDEVLKLGTLLNKMIDASNELGKCTGDIARLEDESEEILKHVTRLKELLNESEKGGEEERRKREALIALESEISRLDAALRSLEESTGYREFIKRKEELEGLTDRIDAIEGTVFKHVNSIKRVLRKYEKNLESRGGGDKQLADKLRQYISDPKAAFRSESGGMTHLKEILTGLKEELSKADLRIDPKELGKTYSKVEEFRRWLEGEGSKIDKLRDEKKVLHDALSGLHIEKEREEILSRKKDLERRLEEESQVKKTKPVDSSGIESHKQKIEGLLSNIEKRPVQLKL